MEVVVLPVQEFHFESATTTPYMSAPSSPKHFGLDPLEFYYPTAASLDIDDFAFDFSGHLQNNAHPPALTSADELFDQGKIRPLMKPFAVNRGRDTTPVSAFSPTISPSQRPKVVSRSLSPLRAESTDRFQAPISSHPPPIAAISCSCTGGGEGSWKWRFKDFLLFRSASEGRATGDVSRSSSFRSTGSSGSARRRGSARRAVSPHARHYAANKAAAEEMKKKTALPYRQSFFSCLRFSPALHSLTGRGW